MNAHRFALPLFFVAASLPSLAQDATAASPTPAPWLLAYNGKSTNALALDKRFPGFLHTHITGRLTTYWTGKPSRPSHDAIDFLHGPPDEAHVAQNRYLTASACVAHDATECGLLWVDTQTGATVFAASVYAVPTSIATHCAHLWLFTNTPMQTLPPTLTAAIAPWSAQPLGDGSHTLITDITLVQPDGTQLRLSHEDAHTWQPPTATATKPAGK